MVVEVEVPRWVEERDVHVRITGREVSVWVNTSPGGGLLLDKVMFIDEEEARKKKGCVGEAMEGPGLQRRRSISPPLRVSLTQIQGRMLTCA